MFYKRKNQELTQRNTEKHGEPQSCTDIYQNKPLLGGFG